jgi:NifU-like protein involved in Fe-S cluster formation
MDKKFLDALIDEFSSALPHEGRLIEPTISIERRSVLCGATIRVDLAIDKGHVSDFSQEMDAGILGRAAAILLGQKIIGSSLRELEDIHRKMHDLLRTGEPPNFQEKWKNLSIFQSIHPYPMRHGSVLLPFDAVAQAIDKYRESLKTNT